MVTVDFIFTATWVGTGAVSPSVHLALLSGANGVDLYGMQYPRIYQ